MRNLCHLGLALGMLTVIGCGRIVDHEVTQSGDDVVFSFESNLEEDVLRQVIVTGPFDTQCEILSFETFGEDPVVWEIEDSSGLPDTVTYGIVPDGAEEIVPAEVLEPGACYHAKMISTGAAWVTPILAE